MVDVIWFFFKLRLSSWKNDSEVCPKGIGFIIGSLETEFSYSRKSILSNKSEMMGVVTELWTLERKQNYFKRHNYMTGNSSNSTEKLLWMEKRKVRSLMPAIMTEMFKNYQVSLITRGPMLCPWVFLRSTHHSFFLGVDYSTLLKLFLL